MHTMPRLLVLICLTTAWAIGCTPATAPPEEEALPETPAEGLVITNARIIDGTDAVIDPGSVVVRDGRIVSVGAGEADVPGALVIDAQGKTVMPGFIDGHRHVIGGEADQWLAEQADDRMREFLEAGFTTLYSAGDAQDAILELRRRLAAREVAGPRLFAAGRAPLARAAGGRGRRDGDPARFDNSRPPLRPTEPAGAVPDEDTRARVQAIKDAGFDAVKTVITVTPGGPEQATLSVIADESERLDLLSITHAVTVQDTLAAVETGTAVLVHTPHIGHLTEAQAQMVADSGIPMVSTLGIFVPFFDEDNAPIFRDALPFPWDTVSSAGQGPVNARLLWEAGVVYGYGTDTRFLPRDTLAHELKSLHLVFSEKDIVQIMTRNAALAIGLGDEVGTLEAGKLADVVILDGDPLTDLYDLLNVDVVIKDGNIVLDHR